MEINDLLSSEMDPAKIRLIRGDFYKKLPVPESQTAVRGGAEFLKGSHKVLSNEPIFSRIHLDGQYL